MKNTKKRMEKFNNIAFEMYNDLKLIIKDIHLSEYCLSFTALTNNHSKRLRIYTIQIYENEIYYRCAINFSNSLKMKRYIISKKL